MSGGGVAGSTVAYWLRRHGFEPTVVERAPGLRQGGQAVDFRGAALTVLSRTGVLEQVKARDTGIGDCTIVDADGTPYAVMPSVLYAGELEVLIDELIAILYARAAGAGVEYRFGDSVTALDADELGVTATFRQAPPERFDLVYESALRDHVAGNQEIGVEGSRYVFVRPTQEMFDAMAAAARESEDPAAEPTLNVY
ncbi:MAG TPA: FAD-dependent monooxygenase [Actinocatenispora sp.]